MTDFYDYETAEYKQKAAIRRARVEAEKKRQLRNRKIFFGSLILLVFIVLAVVLIFVLRKAVSGKEHVNAGNDIANQVTTVEQSGETVSVETESVPNAPIATGKDLEDELDGGGDSMNPDPDEAAAALGLERKDDPSSGTGTLTAGLGTLKKRFELDGSNYIFTLGNSATYMGSDEFTSSEGLVIDYTDKKVLAQKDGYSKMFPASMTKVMTVLTARMYISDEHLDDKVALSYNAISFDLKNGCSSAGFEEGEVVTVRDLFYGTILPSGGEAAYMLAEYTAGSHEAFVELMNENVKALGLDETTHFANAAGVYNDMNYSTCNDIAVILAAAMEDDFLAEVLNARKYTTSVSEQHPEGIEISNWFLRRIEDKDTGGNVIGAKTGFVNQSGCCGVSMMKGNNGHDYICVSGNAWSSWRCIYDHVAAYNIYALGNTGYHKN